MAAFLQWRGDDDGDFLDSVGMEPAAVALLYQAALEQLPVSARLLVVHAHADPLLPALQQRFSLTLQQHHKQHWLELAAFGLAVTPVWPEAVVDAVLILPSKNRQQTLAWMARAMRQLVPGGVVMFACANRHGAKSYQQALTQLAGAVACRSKAKCRLLAARRSDQWDEALAQAWLEAAARRQVAAHGLWSEPGLFSWASADRGSQLLLEALPALAGGGMDLCCGYGLLSVELLRRCAQVTQLHLVEADRYALDCACLNVADVEAQVEAHWLDATREALPQGLDWVLCNPPFHQGQQRDVALGQAIVQRGCRSLRRGGRIYMVANRQLPYERLLQAELSSVQTLHEAEGFKILMGVR